ncbi:uncharacterized protein LOC117104306 [Anneissia japonica]|uniref:uncharacterized protein LOC117104306 n=1 Tax=Anneissia japonica TaxID=1529436 RepID=UPI0014258B67|nr:uncharacterized protein LOC117104306 [Anneissia japonica]
METTKTIIWIVLCVAHHGFAFNLTTVEHSSLSSDMEYFTAVTEIITQFTTTHYEDPTMGSVPENGLPEERIETTIATGNSTFQAKTPEFLNSLGSSSTDDVVTASESLNSTGDKQTTMASSHISTITDFGEYSESTEHPDPKMFTSLDTVYTSPSNLRTNHGVSYAPTSTTNIPVIDDKEVLLFSQTVVFVLIGIVSVLGAIFIICIIVKICTCYRKRSKKSKRKHSWKRAKTAISDTYFTIMSGKRPPLPPRNARRHRDDAEDPYHVPVLLDLSNKKIPYESNFETMVYQNSENSTNQIPPGNTIDAVNMTSTVIHTAVENIYETAFHNNGLSPDDDESGISPPNAEVPRSDGPTDEESRAVKRYISMRCRPDQRDELQRSSACSGDSAIAVNGDKVIDEYINNLLKFDHDGGEPRSPEYNTYDSVPQNPFRFPKSDSEHTNGSHYVEKSFINNEDVHNLESPDYNMLQFREPQGDTQKYASYLPKNDDNTKASLNGVVAGGNPVETISPTVPSVEMNTVNELQNEYTIDPTNLRDTATVKDGSEGIIDIRKNSWKQRGLSWRI